jgi:hypothetical protein
MPSITPAIGNGRNITDYSSKCELEQKLKAQFKIGSDSEYRKKLQREPKMFDAAIKGYTKDDAYFPITPCVDNTIVNVNNTTA